MVKSDVRPHVAAMPNITGLTLDDQRISPSEGTSPSLSPREDCSSSGPHGTSDAHPEGRTAATRKKTPPGFPDQVYLHAASIFQQAYVENPACRTVVRYGPRTAGSMDLPAGDPAEARDKRAERQAHELAFNSLMYQELLEDIMTDSCFYPSQQTPEDLMALVVVMLYDLMDRKFLLREPIAVEGEETIEEVREVESSLCRFRTKLAASLARSRIKRGIHSIVHMLPESVRQRQERTHTLQVYGWINTLMTSLEEVCVALQAEGFSEVKSHTHLEKNEFSRDTHCSDLLVFHTHAKPQLCETTPVKENKLIIQDKSFSLAACALRPLLATDCAVLMVGFFSPLTVARVAVQAAACAARVYICGVLTGPAHREELLTVLSDIGCKNVQLLTGDFGDLNEWDSRAQKVRTILLFPQNSATAVCNPVEHVLSENGDREVLKDLTRGFISDSKLASLVTKQMQDLSHALSFPKAYAVVYCTCSVRAEENEELVKRALENADKRPKLVPFRLVSPGLNEANEGFFRLEASDLTNGCFLCVLAREPDPATKETAQDILARAVAKGLLTGLAPPEPIQTRKKSRRRGAAKTSIPVHLSESPATPPKAPTTPLPPHSPSPTPSPPCSPSELSDSANSILSSNQQPSHQRNKRKKRVRRHSRKARQPASNPRAARRARPKPRDPVKLPPNGGKHQPSNINPASEQQLSASPTQSPDQSQSPPLHSADQSQSPPFLPTDQSQPVKAPGCPTVSSELIQVPLLCSTTQSKLTPAPPGHLRPLKDRGGRHRPKPQILSPESPNPKLKAPRVQQEVNRTKQELQRHKKRPHEVQRPRRNPSHDMSEPLMDIQQQQRKQVVVTPVELILPPVSQTHLFSDSLHRYSSLSTSSHRSVSLFSSSSLSRSTCSTLSRTPSRF